MRQLTNLVSGNNVIKYYIINSNKDFREVQAMLKITDKSSIITRVDSSIGADTLNIPRIDGFNQQGSTDSKKFSMYNRLQAEGNNRLVLGSIFERAHISRGR
jgi:hypothetical protein